MSRRRAALFWIIPGILCAIVAAALVFVHAQAALDPVGRF